MYVCVRENRYVNYVSTCMMINEQTNTKIAGRIKNNEQKNENKIYKHFFPAQSSV